MKTDSITQNLAQGKLEEDINVDVIQIRLETIVPPGGPDPINRREVPLGNAQFYRKEAGVDLREN